MAEHGGQRKGAGRKPIAEEEKAKELINKALKLIYKKDVDEENAILFLKDFAATGRGQQFIAEHLIGKPKERVDITSDDEQINVPIMQWANSKKE